MNLFTAIYQLKKYYNGRISKIKKSGKGVKYMDEDTKISQSETTKSGSTLWIAALILIVIIAGIIFLSNRNTTSTNNNGSAGANTTSSPSIAPTATAVTVKEVTVNGKNFAFLPSTITVHKGDKVKIVFKDDEGFHNLTVEGYNVSTKTIQSGGTDSAEFTADKAGTFAYYCSVDSHRGKGMEGKLIVQ